VSSATARLAQLSSALRVWAAYGVEDDASADTARELADASGLRGVVLVEGASDRIAVEATAERLGRSLVTEGLCILAMDGATNIGRYLTLFGPGALDVPVAGLYDVAEERFFCHALEDAGLAATATREDLAECGFFACVVDLEDELIRAAGTAAVEDVVRARGEMRPLETFRCQPAHRDSPPERQLRRFMGTTSGRKALYARALAERLDPGSTPAPLARLLSRI
jgi:hypothetical protein